VTAILFWAPFPAFATHPAWGVVQTCAQSGARLLWHRIQLAPFFTKGCSTFAMSTAAGLIYSQF